MQKITKSSWPVLVVSDKINLQDDEGVWLRNVLENLTVQQDCTVINSYGFGDAHDIVHSREDLGAIVVDWDMDKFGRMHKKNAFLMERADNDNMNPAAVFIEYVRTRNKYIPILLLTDRGSIEDIPDYVLSMIDEVIWKLTDTYQFIAGRIERKVIEYSESILPEFFKELALYVNEYKYAWHTPGHMGGEGFLRSPSGTAFHKFFGENVLRSDLSISVPELGSLLDHSGLTGDAENFSAGVFGADKTYYILNGTSTANQVIWRSQLLPSDTAIIDRNCHKSLNYAMIITSAHPDYMVPMRNGLGIIGPVDFSKIRTDVKYKMSALTNSTYDGICYDTNYVSNQLKCADILHFDEAWYAYARFHPIYSGHYGMSLPNSDKLVFCSQSTHKLLTAFSQASMIHVRFPDNIKDSEPAKKAFHDLFNESYMMHGSTSPQYSMIASLEVASKMMHDNGESLFSDIIEEAIELRKKVAEIHKAGSGWFFGIWQPDCIADTDTEELAKNQDYWKLKPGDSWHGFNLKDEYVMLDPIKLTFVCPGIGTDGSLDPDWGIPAAIVTNYLIDKGIVCEKTDYYSWLMLNSPGTTNGKQGTLLAELFKFKDLYDSNAPLKDVFPELTSRYPEKYGNIGLKEHCLDMHKAIIGLDLMKLMNEAFNTIPTQKLLPYEAYRKVVGKEVDFVELRDIDPANNPRIAGVMLVPYPPGIPIMMGGEEFNEDSQDILNYLLARQDFENQFPGYESDIHGIERTVPDEQGKKYFTTILVRN